MSIDPSRPVLITGGAGFLGARVAAELRRRYPQIHIHLTDLARTPRLDPLLSHGGDQARFTVGDLADRGFVDSLITGEVGTVFHLASLVSGGAEKDFTAGLQANVYATINLLEACRAAGGQPVLVFTSSIATFGGSELPEEIDDWTFQHPQNSYGVAKVLGEQLLNDYSRKGFLSGRGVRLPAIAVRDVSNTAASGYASTMVRELLSGNDYTCPVAEETRIPIMGAVTAVNLLVELAELPDTRLGDYRSVNGHGISPTAREIADAVAAGGSGAAPGAVTFRPEADVQSIVAAWPRVMHAQRADELGLPREESAESIVRAYLSERSEGGKR